jgi:hypothetical protein
MPLCGSRATTEVPSAMLTVMLPSDGLTASAVTGAVTVNLSSSGGVPAAVMS